MPNQKVPFKNRLIKSHIFSATEKYGTCCGANKPNACGGYAGGKSALEHANEGLFDKAPTVEWTLGQVADVYWSCTACHDGAYAYRLCKVKPKTCAFFQTRIVPNIVT